MSGSPKYRYRVDIIESESGWKTEVIDSEFFDEECAASKFIQEYNKEHNWLGCVPEYYVIASYAGKVRVN